MNKTKREIWLNKFGDFCLRQPAALVFLVLLIVPLLPAVAVLGYQDLQIISAPGNPPSGYLRFSAQTGTLGCLTSAGANCLTAAPSGTAGGDLSGSYPNPTVVKINGTSLAGLATGILKNTTSTGVPSIAAAADVYGLFSGTCSSTTYLSGSGACSTPSGSGFANPMTTEGDIIYGGSSGTPTRLGAGTSGYVLSTQGTGAGPQWIAAGGTSGMTQISQQVLASPAASVTFTSIPGTYSQLLLEITASSSISANNDAMDMVINSDTTSGHYSTSAVYSIGGGGPTATGATSGGSMAVGSLTGATSTLLGGATTITLVGYAGTTFAKTMHYESGTPVGGASIVEDGGGVWVSTSAITTLKFTPATGPNFVTGSTFTLYGMQ
jgi:hypothetical protein